MTKAGLLHGRPETSLVQQDETCRSQLASSGRTRGRSMLLHIWISSDQAGVSKGAALLCLRAWRWRCGLRGMGVVCRQRSRPNRRRLLYADWYLSYFIFAIRPGASDKASRAPASSVVGKLAIEPSLRFRWAGLPTLSSENASLPKETDK
ncbi:hypothetical protein CH063_00794 [Colletotrichum higginsianum]|uniref:Uncharacterized protein n=1 Tax=Colletotrichum higginsianum (strain IMI 349063) TaxID=759273 RepID=H1UWL7_COLHI|nr:hypothetical protein CH063_00794 [Colletotrichum higginsianum]